MRTTSLLLSLVLGLIPTSSALSNGQENIDGPILARSAASPLKEERNVAISHLHRRHEQPANKPNHISRSKKKRLSLIDSILANAGLTSDDLSNQNNGYTYTQDSSTTDTTDTTNTQTDNNPPAEKLPVAQVSRINDAPASSASSPIPAASSKPPPGTCTSTTPAGCANEDGASTGDPNWTCASGGSTTPAKRTLLTPRLHPRQSPPTYITTLNSYRCLFCLPPLSHSTALEASAQRQGSDSAAAGRMVETPPSGEGTVMAIGGGADFETALLFWLCEVHTTNMDSCTCANAYGRPGFKFTWTERGHYDFLAGKEAGGFGSVGCAYDEAMGGLWTCALGVKGGE